MPRSFVKEDAMAQGAFVIIQNDGRDILLVKRKDIPLWDLPGAGSQKVKHLNPQP